MKHCEGYYYQFPKDLLSADLYKDLSNIHPGSLEVTTRLDRLSTIKSLISNGQWRCVKSFVTHYGILGQRIACLKNLRLPSYLECRVIDDIKRFIALEETPVVRMQMIFGGSLIPVHIDPTRTASLVIPLINHQGSFTRFYHGQDLKPGLICPNDVQWVRQIEIVEPTLLNTEIAHDVKCLKTLDKSHARISLTVKWGQTKFADVVARIL